MLLKRTQAEIVAEGMEALLDSGAITDVNPGSITRALLDIMATECGLNYDTLEMNVAMRFLSTAVGYFLDLMGEGLFGVPRITAQTALTTLDDATVKFYTSDGSPLASHLVSPLIPGGTSVYTDDETYLYTVSHDIPVDSKQSLVYVPTHAAGAGDAYNVAAGALKHHSLNNTTVKVTNVQGIGNGSNDESNDNYRFRITRSLRSYARANITAVRMAALSVPAIADVNLTSARSGVGTFDVLVMPTGNRVSSETMRQVAAAIGYTKAAGIISSIRQPQYVSVELVIQVKFNNLTPEASKFDTRQRVVENVLGYVGEVRMGGVFILNELRERVMSASPNILDMEILCYIFRNRPQLLRNYTLGADELLLPDPNKDEPIKII